MFAAGLVVPLFPDAAEQVAVAHGRLPRRCAGRCTSGSEAGARSSAAQTVSPSAKVACQMAAISSRLSTRSRLTSRPTLMTARLKSCGMRSSLSAHLSTGPRYAWKRFAAVGALAAIASRAARRSALENWTAGSLR